MIHDRDVHALGPGWPTRVSQNQPLSRQHRATTIDIGAFADYSDTYGGGDNGMNPASVTITVVPEPGAVAASLAAIGSVFGVAAVRRRR